MVDLAAMTDEELEAENQRLMAERGKAEQTFKAAQKVIQDELDKRASAKRLATVLGTLTDDDKEALKQHLALGRAKEG